MMDELVVLAVQCTFSMVMFFLITRWYIAPRVSRENKFQILSLFLIINTFRYLPLALFMPGQVSPEFPELVKEIVAHGDFLSSIFALVALLLVRFKSKLSIAFIWIFSLVSIADMILALTFAMKAKVYLLPLGVNYYTVSVYVPMLMVIQYYIISILLNKKFQ